VQLYLCVVMTETKLFGTNGVRGVINESLTVDIVLNLGRAIGTVLGPGKIAIARDSRMGGEMFVHAVCAGLLSAGCSIVDIGPAPTPTLQFFIPHSESAGGVMVTASHNPAQFNGVKAIGSDGVEVARSVEDQIESIYRFQKFTLASWSSIGTVVQNMSAPRQHIDSIKTFVDADTIRKRKITVVIDSANSVGGLVTPLLLRELGCRVISLNSQLDGHFPGRPPEPIAENLSELCNAVKSVGADLGIAHDGDADRARFVDETGRVISGDQSFAVIAKRILAKHPGSTLVTPVSSGRLIEDVANEVGAKIEWTKVGSVDVSHRLMEINGTLGGEENGGVFFPPHQPVRDGSMTSAQIVDIIASEEKSLSELVEELPRYFSVKTKVPVPVEKKDQMNSALLSVTEGQDRITMDGVKILYDDGWILLRPSGTEPLYRCFVESKSQERADQLSRQGKKLIEEALKQI
jgi:phosphomannomutase/phosphoglucomutase